jgi:hypothetical protein
MATAETAQAVADRIMGRPDEDAALKIIMGNVKQSAKEVEEDDDELLGSDPDEDEPDDDDDQDDQDDQDDDQDDDDDAAEVKTLDYTDEDLISVTVDGKQVEVTMKDLKQRFSGEGAIEKRLQEATELRKTAQAEREKAEGEIADHRAKLLQTLTKLDGALFMPLIKAPDPALRQKNMQEYLLQKDAYTEDQARIAELKNGVVQMFNNHNQEIAAKKTERRKAQSELLLQKHPELSKPDENKAFQDEVMLAITTHGFTREQLNEVDDHAMLLLARDAGRWLKLQAARQSKANPQVGDGSDPKAKTVRHLRPGSQAATSASQLAAKRYAKAEAKARATGSVDDVAEMITARNRVSQTSRR